MAFSVSLSPTNHGSVMDKVMLVFDTVAGSSARKLKKGVISTHALTTSRLASERAINSGKPPIDFAQFNASIASSIASIDGVFIGADPKIASFSLL